MKRNAIPNRQNPLLGLVQDVHVKGRSESLLQGLEVAVHLLLRLLAEDLLQHRREHGELVRVVGEPELAAKFNQ